MLQVLKMVEQIEMTDQRNEMSEQPANLTKYTGLGAAIAAELMIDLWFVIGVILVVAVVDGLNHCNGMLTSGGSK